MGKSNGIEEQVKYEMLVACRGKNARASKLTEWSH